MADLNTIINTIKSSNLPQVDKDIMISKINNPAMSPQQRGEALSSLLDIKITELEGKVSAADTKIVEDAQNKLESLQADLEKSLTNLDEEAKNIQ